MKKLFLIIVFFIIPISICEGFLTEPDITLKKKSNIDIYFNVYTEYNNPGNLRSVKTGKFRKFKTMKEGYDALIYDLNMKISGESAYTDSTTTVEQFIHIYAPPFENDTKKYIEIVCTELNINKKIKLYTLDAHELAKAMIKVEDVELYKIMYASR